MTYQNILWYYVLWYWANGKMLTEQSLLRCWFKAIPDTGEKIHVEVSLFSSDLPRTISYHTWFLWPSSLSLCDPHTDDICYFRLYLTFLPSGQKLGIFGCPLGKHRRQSDSYTNQAYWQIWRRSLVLWFESLSPLNPFFIGLSAAFWGVFSQRSKF